MQLIDGQLYPPMSARVGGKLREPIVLGKWEKAEEQPELADDKGNFVLNKGNGSSLKAKYNPYFHTSRTPLNDQFTSAYNRPNLVTVEVEVPESELSSGYKAEKAKDSVGEMTWHSGPVSGKLPEGKKRKVILSRWDKPVRVLPDSEVADRIAELLDGENIAIPYNVVTPGLRSELARRGVAISDSPSGTVRDNALRSREGSTVERRVSGAELAATKATLYRRGQSVTENLREPITRARAITEAVNLAKSLGIKFKEDPTLTEKGSFDPKTGQIRINIDNHNSSADLQATVIHEAVGHYGLRKLLGKDFTAQMREIYDNCAPSIKAEIDRIAKEEGYDTIGAVEEYLSQLAEDGRFTPQEESFWQRVWYAVQQMLRKLGWKGNLTEADMRALLYASHRNLQTRGAVAQAHHITVYNALRKQADLSHLESDNEGPEDDGPGGGKRISAEKEQIKEQAIKDGTFMLAPNGAQTNLTEDQWLTVRTKAFKNWFGEWEKDPKNASKIVDENGEPMVMVHGSQAKFTVFKPGGPFGTSGRGMYFGRAPQNAETWTYGGANGYKYLCFLNVRNLYDGMKLSEKDDAGKRIYTPIAQAIIGADSYEQFKSDWATANKNAPAWANEQVNNISEKTYQRIHDKYDGKGLFSSDKQVEKHLFGKNEEYLTLNPEFIGEIVVRNPNQIKSAVDNSGRFDVSNPDIKARPVGEYSESEENNVPLQWQDNELPANDFYDARGERHDGLNTILHKAQEELESLDKESDAANQIVQRIAAIQQELSARSAKQQEWKEKYHIGDDGRISLEDLSAMYKDYNDDEDLAELFEKVKSLAKQIGLDIKFKDTLDDAGQSEYNGRISFLLDFLTASGTPDFGVSAIILHELIHSVTQSTTYAYRKGGKLADSLTKSQKKAVQELNAVFDELFQQTLWEDVPYWAEYGLQNADEMMAELANPSFRMFLMDVPTASGNKNFLQRIVDAIKRLFGFGANNMFDKAERALDRMLNNFSMDTFETVRQSIDDIDWDSYADDSGLTDDGINDLPKELREEAIRQNTKALYRSGAKLANAAQTYAQVANGKDVLYEVLVDEYAPVDTFSDAMVQDSKIDIKDSERVSDAFREIGGKAEKAIKDFNHKFLEPLWDAVGRFQSAANIKAGEFVNYIGLKSGLERNVVFAARDARHDYQTEYSAVENDANKEIRRINIDEKKKLERLQKQLDEGKISDVAYSNGVVRVQLEAKTLRQKQQDDIDAAKAVLDAHLKDIKAGIDPRFLEYRKKDYSAIMAWAGTDNLEDAEDLARDYVNDIESRAGSDMVDELWDKMNAATKETLRFQYEHDMLTKQQYDDVRTMMQYYVPMRGFQQDTAEDLYNYYVSAQKQTFQPTIPTAKGRKTLFESPLGYIGAMHASAVAQGLKNQAKLSLLNLVRNRKGSNLASITRAWFVNTHVKDASGRYIYEVRYPDIPEGTDRDTREKIIKDFEDEMKDLRMNGDAYNSHREVDLHGGVVAFEKEAHKNEHMVKVREGGREFGIIINGNPAAAQAINGVRRGGGYGSFLDAAHTFTRALSQMFTTFSIPFWVSNFQRDFGQGVTNNFIRNKGEYLGKYFKNYAKAFKVFYLAMGSDKIDKSIAGGSEIAKLYKEYLENGGPMGQNRVENNEYYERQMKRYLKNAGKKGVIAAGRDVLEFVGAVGEAVETITRFATFMTSREMGRPIHEAISDAKEVSTNFARKGSGRALTRDEVSRLTRADGTKLNKAEQNALLTISWGVEFFRATIPFFNAAVQGLENKGTNYREHFAKTLISDVTYFVLGFGMRMLLGAMGGDDDKEKYSHTSDYLRRNNILTPLGNGWYSKWALPQEYRVCYALGDILASAMSQDRPLDDLGIDALGSILQLSPVGAVTDEVLFSGGDVQKAGWNLLIGLMPGVVDPILESLLNRDFKGSRLYNEGFNDNLRKYPGWTKAIDSTGEAYTAVAEQMNKLHIGKDDEGKWGVWIADDVQNRVLRGTFNINPAIVEHLVESYFSGPYQVVKLGAAGVKAVTKGGVKTRDIPFWNRFVLNTNDNDRDAYYSNMYYYFKDISTETERVFSEYKKAGSTEHMKDLSKNKDYQYMLAFKMADAQEKALRKQGKLAEQKGDLELKKQAEAKLQKLHEDIAKRCLDIYFDREQVK